MSIQNCEDCKLLERARKLWANDAMNSQAKLKQAKEALEAALKVIEEENKWLMP